MKKKPVPLTTLPVIPPAPAQPPAVASGSTLQKNQQWFDALSKSVEPIKVVAPPLQAAVVKGFPVPCSCIKESPMTSLGRVIPKPNCSSCGGNGFVLIAQG